MYSSRNEFLKLIIENKLLCIIFLVIIFSYTIYSSLVPINKARNAKNWKKTECYIKSSYMTTDPSFWEVFGRSRRRGGFSKRPQVTYYYTVKGKRYTGTKYSFKKPSDPNILYNYPKGSRSICYVNPKNPKQAVLSRELASGTVLWSVIKISASSIVLLIYSIYIYRTRNEIEV